MSFHLIEDLQVSFDGVPRPSQLTPYATGGMNPYAAANAARVNNAGKPLIQKPTGEEKIKATHREEREYQQAEDDEERGELFSEEEAEQIRIMAKMRGIMNLALEAGKRYEFQINVEAGCVDLIDVDEGTVILQLLPEELMKLSQKIQRYGGMLADRAG